MPTPTVPAPRRVRPHRVNAVVLMASLPATIGFSARANLRSNLRPFPDSPLILGASTSSDTVVDALEDWTDRDSEASYNGTIGLFEATAEVPRETALRASSAFESSSLRSCYFWNFPIEPGEEFLNTDQKIMGAVLKEPVLEVASFGLVVLSSSLVALSTLDTINLTTLARILRTENILAVFLGIEFLARWYAQFSWKGIPRYLLQPFVLIDLVVVVLPLIPLLVPSPSSTIYELLPNWLFSSAGLINLRFLRILRLQRVLADMQTFSDFCAGLGILQPPAGDSETADATTTTIIQPYKLNLARVILSIFTLFSISSGLIYSTEYLVNPQISTYLDALYFTLTTLTTVGFGDITPVTPDGKLVVSASILAGVAVIPAQAAALVEALLAREEYKTTGATASDDNRSAAPLPSASTPADASPMQASRMNMRSGLSDKGIEHANESAMTMVMQKCSACSADFHWANARYCWSCGTKLTEGD